MPSRVVDAANGGAGSVQRGPHQHRKPGFAYARVAHGRGFIDVEISEYETDSRFR
jgi:hypothetical protein